MFAPWTNAQAGGRWQNAYLPQRYGAFTVTFTMQAYENNDQPIDAVVGLGNGTTDGFSDLGPIVRMSPAGTFDARDGNTYRALATVPYQSGWNAGAPAYPVRMAVDLARHTYSVWVTPPGGSEVMIAENFAFRTEQSALARIDTLSSFVDSPTGLLIQNDARVSPPLCVTSSESNGWGATTFPAYATNFYVEMDVTPQASGLDAVVGLSNGRPTSFASLGPIMRMNPEGFWDARDGDHYSAAMSAPVVPGYKHELFFIVNMDAHTYSAHVTEPNGSWPEVASNYAFRTEQQGVGQLDTIGQLVDGTPGTLSACDPVISPQ